MPPTSSRLRCCISADWPLSTCLQQPTSHSTGHLQRHAFKSPAHLHKVHKLSGRGKAWELCACDRALWQQGCLSTASNPTRQKGPHDCRNTEVGFAMASLSYSTVISAHLAAVDVQLAAAAVGDGEGAVGAQRQPSLEARHPRRIPLPAQIHVHLRIASPNLGKQTNVQQTPGNGC